MNTIFNQCGVSITDFRDADEDKVAGRIQINWTETSNRGMMNFYEYENLVTRKVAMTQALDFASQMMRNFAE